MGSSSSVENSIRAEINKDPNIKPEERDEIFADTMACHYMVQHSLHQHMNSWCIPEKLNVEKCTNVRRISPEKLAFEQNPDAPCVYERDAMMNCLDYSLGEYMSKELEPYAQQCASECDRYDACFDSIYSVLVLAPT
eukprot:TRINITY_DN1691_c0_g1_i6.p1 TRINITY_DN1691_c0_g1~~TRINITY_DN1691_c0_g1_i6.p1  ORF type:complete len:137 (+),score=15.34 TRINITY_DN1691_c0_g1_i6:75-485(+)